MEFTNDIYQSGADIEAFSSLVKLLAPITPHFSEELWQILGNKESIIKTEWPKFDPKMLIESSVTIVIQVNGKVRSKMDVPADITETKLKELVLADEKVKQWTEAKPVRNFILVPGKLVNIVV